MKGKVVIITGASSGIGKALAKRFAAGGSKVVLAARRMDALAEIAKEITQKGGECLTVQADVGNKEDCGRMVEETVKKFGGVDILINNAGISMRALVEDLEPEVIEKVMQVNFFGTMYSTFSALKYIIKAKGSIVGISSIAGYRGLPARSGYSASKFAMNGFLESLRTELLMRGVHVLVASPGFTTSNIRNVALSADGSSQGDTPLKEDKLMSAEEVADRIYNAVVKRKRTVIMTSQGKMTVLMNKLFPKWMDKIVYKHFLNEPDSPLKNKK